MQFLTKLAFSAIVSSTAAFKNSQTLETAQSTDLDGSFSLDLEQQVVEVVKYNNLIDRSISYRSSDDDGDIFATILSMLTGKSFSSSKFENQVDALFRQSSLRSQNTKLKRDRLGQSGSNFEISLADGGFMWSAPVYMGASMTPINMVFDLGSDWLTAQAFGCKNCKGNSFDTSKGTKTSNVIDSHLYGSANLTGYPYKD